MSRSYRKPYASICGNGSAADDKMHAARGMRRAQNQSLRNFRDEDWDDFIMPVRHECSWNNTYSWGRDGCQSLQFPPQSCDHLRWHHVCECTQEEIQADFDEDMERYERLKRK